MAEPIYLAHPVPARMWLLLMGNGAFVLLGLWFTGLLGGLETAAAYKDGSLPIVGWSCVALFGFNGAVQWRKAVDREVQLRLSPDGLYWKRHSRQTIPWAAIKGVRLFRYRANRSILIDLVDPRAYPPAGLLGRSRLLHGIVAGGDLSISLQGTDGKVDGALAVINHYWRPPQ